MDTDRRLALVVDAAVLRKRPQDARLQRVKDSGVVVVLCNDPNEKVDPELNAVVVRNTGDKPRLDFIRNSLNVIRGVSNIEPVVYWTERDNFYTLFDIDDEGLLAVII